MPKTNNLAKQLALDLEKQIEEQEPSSCTLPTNVIRSDTAPEMEQQPQREEEEQDPESEENPYYGTDAIRTQDFTQEFVDVATPSTSHVIRNAPETAETDKINEEASIGDMLSDIFIGTPANEDSDAIRNQQSEDYAEDCSQVLLMLSKTESHMF